MKSRKRISDQLRLVIFKRDNWKCKICGRQVRSGKKRHRQGHLLAVADHIIPKSKNGPDTLENLQTLCRYCDEAKADKILTEQVIEMSVKFYEQYNQRY